MVSEELRDRTRRAVREEVIARAWDLFARKGFEGTTVDEIATAAGMSRRSFFRYFASKENLLLEQLLDHARTVADAFGQRPAEEPLWTSLRAAFEPLVTGHEAHPEYAKPLIVMLRESDLRATLQERRVRMEELLTPLVAERLSGEEHRAIRARSIAGAAVSCFVIAQQAWADDGVGTFGALLDAAMGSIAVS